MTYNWEAASSRRETSLGALPQATRWWPSDHQPCAGCLAETPGLGLRRWLLILVAGWAGATSLMAEVQFQAQGVVTLTMHGGRVFQDTGQPSRSARFTVAVSNACWFLWTDFGEGYLSEYGSDGTAVIWTMREVLGAGQGKRRSHPFFSVKPAHDRWGFDSWAEAIWFALASGSYFKERGLRDLVPPLSSPGSDPIAYIFHAEGTLTNDTFPLPVGIRFRVSEEGLRTAPSRPELAHMAPGLRQRSLDWIPAGLLGCEYRAEDWIRISGIWIPRRFEIVSYHLHEHGPRAPDPGAIDVRCSGVITNVNERVEHVGPPRMEGVARVVDYRLAQGRPGVAHGEYYVTNGVWPSLEEAAQRARFYTWRGGHGAVSLDAGSPAAGGSRSKRAILLGIFCALALVPLGIWIARAWQRGTRDTQERLSS